MGRFAVDARERGPDAFVAQRAEPPAPGLGVFYQPGADRLDHEDVRQARHDRLAARLARARLGGHEAQRAVHPLRVRCVPCLDVDQAGQQIDKVACGRVIDAHGAADERRLVTAAAVGEHFVPRCDALDREIEVVDCARALALHDEMARAAWHQRELARAQHRRLGIGELDSALARGHDVEHHAIGHRRHHHAPGGGQV